MSKKNFYLHMCGKRIRVTEEVYREYYQAKDKEQYFMERLKKGYTIIDPDTGKRRTVPGREQSFEQLLGHDQKFPSQESVEEEAVRAVLLDKLQEVLHSLSDDEMALVEELFYLEKTEREAAKRFEVSQNTIHYRKKKVLDKLRKLMEK